MHPWTNPSTTARSPRSADGTQEVDAADVLEVIAPGGSVARGPAAANELVDVRGRIAHASRPSIDPVDIDTDAPRRSSADVSDRRKRLRAIVVGTVGLCCAVLAAAGARLLVEGLTPARATTVAFAGDAALHTTRDAMARAAAAVEAAKASTVGTLRFDEKAFARGVWVDGARLTARAAVLPCGSHKVRVGARGATRPATLPCGGELVVSR